MKPSFLILAGADLILLVATAVLGLQVRGTERFLQHFLLGLLAGLYTCFVHVVFFMYFVIQGKIMKQGAVAGGVESSLLDRTDSLKSRALRSSMLGICAILLTVGLGAAIGILVPAEVHLVAAFVALGLNAAIFAYQYTLLGEYAVIFTAAFPEG